MENIAEMLQVLTDMLFFAPLKHPVRNAIVKLLQKSQIYHGMVVNCLADTIAENIDELLLASSSAATIDEYNRVICSILGCFENFPIALMSLKMCLLRIYRLIQDAIIIYLNELQ